MIDAALQLGAEQLPGGLSLNDGIDARTMAGGQALAQQISTSEWLGPLAPIALSPFFGLCALSGIATYGPQWLQDRSALFGDASMLNNPPLFWTMLVLAVITSLPRLTKVSKPVALAAENLETYSAVIILVVVRMLTPPEITTGGQAGVALGAASQPVMLSAGFSSFSVNAVVSVFSALNVVVINAIKLFFEFMIWLMPFPAVDAALEVLNKSLCAGLMAVYCYSPTLATVLNLILLAMCALVFSWTRRRLRYYRELVAGPVLAWLFPGWFAQRGDSFVGFCESNIAGLPRCAPVRVRRLGADSFHLQGRRFLRVINLQLNGCQASLQPGILAQQLTLVDGQGNAYIVVHRRWTSADACHELFKVEPAATLG
ncbi:MAG: hypothetical protein R3C53_11710 [Pirellulaceae bacterium]